MKYRSLLVSRVFSTLPVVLSGAIFAATTCWAQAPAINSVPPKRPATAIMPAAGAGNVNPTAPPGQTFTPGTDDSVVVAFPSGQLRAPVVTGGLYNGSQPPPVSNGQQPRPAPVPTRLPIRTRGLPESGSQVSPPPASASKSKCADGTTPDACKGRAKRPAHTDSSNPTPRPTP
jgi:Type VI secretion system/phage-baseplate injector OB domain